MQQINHYLAENGLTAISRIICLGMLVGLSATDLKCRRISTSMLAFGSVLAAGYGALAGRGQFCMGVAGLTAGLVFVLVSKVTREQLGYGDSWLLCILGMYLGIRNLFVLLFAAWMTAAVAAAAVLATHRYRRGTALPMVPFITVGYLVMWAEEILCR